MNLLTLPPRTGDATRDLTQLYDYLAQLVGNLQTQFVDTSALQTTGLGGDALSAGAIVIPNIDFGAPDVPQGLSITPFYDALGLSWQLLLDPTVIGYEVQRATDLAFTANVTTLTMAYAFQYIDKNLGGAGITRYYRIRALRGQEAQVPSGWSSVVTGTTTAATDQLAQLGLWLQSLQTLHLVNAVIDSARIADAAIGTAQIADLAVSTAKIASLAVTDAKINTLSASKLIAGTITVLVKLGVGRIELDGVNDVINFYDNQGTPKIRVKVGKLGAGASDWGLRVFASDGTTVWWDALDSGVQTAGIKNLAVQTAKIADLALTTAKLNTGAVTTPKVSDSQVTTAKRQAVNVTSFAYTLSAIGDTDEGTITHNLGREVVANCYAPIATTVGYVRNNSINSFVAGVFGAQTDLDGTADVVYW